MTTPAYMPALLACQLHTTSKKQLLQTISEMVADRCDVCERVVLSGIMQREKLGSTAIGNGLALPHVALDQVQQNVTLLATLSEPVDFDAADGDPVDVVMAVIGAGQDSPGYLAAVTSASRLLRQFGPQLRSAPDEHTLRKILIGDLTVAA